MMPGMVRETFHLELLSFPGLLLIYYLVGWFLFGRKPRNSVIVPNYDPPKGISPAAARFLRTTGTDGRSVASALADIGVRGCLSISPQSGIYRLTKLVSAADAQKKLPPEENQLFTLIFRSGDSATLDPSDSGHTTLAANLDRSFRNQFGDKYFTHHYGYVFLGALAGFVAVIVALARIGTNERFTALFLTVWLTFVGYILGILFWAFFGSVWQSALRGVTSWKQPMQFLAVFAFFGVGVAFIGFKLSKSSSSAYAVMVAAVILVNVACAPLLKNYTPLGRKTLDEIEGFRQFLIKVEQDRLARLNTPDMKPRLMNEYLPFAIALEVREAWGDHLSDAFLTTGIQR